METNQNNAENAQGANKAKEKQISLSISRIVELAANPKLLQEFIKLMSENENVKAPIAFQFAKMTVNKSK